MRADEPVQVVDSPVEVVRDFTHHAGLEIGAGAEGAAGSRENHGADGLVVRYFGKRLPERFDELGVQRVLGRGTVQRDRRDGTGPLQHEYGFGHDRPSLSEGPAFGPRAGRGRACARARCRTRERRASFRPVALAAFVPRLESHASSVRHSETHPR